MTYLLPPATGLLPYWLLITSVISIGNSIQAYTTMEYTSRVYLGPKHPLPKKGEPEWANSPVTPLSCRTFGTWTSLAALIRLYVAYDVSNPALYQLGLWVYGVAWLHFHSEWLIYKTARWGTGIAGPSIISTGTLIWMFAQWGYYVK